MSVQEAINNLLGNEEELTQVVNNAFTQTDTDNSGEISLDEFLVSFNAVLAEMGSPALTREQAQDAFNSLDTDNSGRLDRAEFRVFVVQMLQLLVTMLNQA